MSRSNTSSGISSESVAPLQRQSSEIRGQRVGDVVKIAKIGNGGFGDVYAGYSSKLDDLVACKRVSRAHYSLNRFASEFDTLNIAKNCPFLVLFLDLSYDDKFIWFITELIYGGTLDPKSQYLVDQKIQITHQLCQALHFLHYKNIAHLDVKPENILIVSQNPTYIKLHDYGISRSQESTDTKIAGTPTYMAPELLKSLFVPKEQRLKIDYYKCDAFSTGLVLFQLFTQNLPQSHRSVKSLESHVIAMAKLETVEQLEISERGQPDLVEKLYGFINCLLKVRPESRYEVTKLFDFMPSLHVPPREMKKDYTWFFGQFMKRGSLFYYLSYKLKGDKEASSCLKNLATAGVLSSEYKFVEALQLYQDNFGTLIQLAKTTKAPKLKTALRQFLSEVMDEAERVKRYTTPQPINSPPRSKYRAPDGCNIS